MRTTSTRSTIRPSQHPWQSSTLKQLQSPISQIRTMANKNKKARTGQHLQTLEDMAHEKTHKEAQEKRAKKKEKKAIRKGKKIPPATATTADHQDDDDDDQEEYDSDHHEDDDQEEGGLVELPDPKDVKEQMATIVNNFGESLRAIRGAEPTPDMFDGTMVDAYGSTTPLNSVAQVVIVSPTLAQATPFDPQLAKNVADAIRKHVEGLNPSVEDAVVKIPIPRMSLERRQQTANVLAKRLEQSKQRIRKVRRKAMAVVKQGMAGRLDGVSKDDAARIQKELETICDQAIEQMVKVAHEKEKSIMEV